ncbi:MAG: IS481 family transposase [Clostridia bacterium]
MENLRKQFVIAALNCANFSRLCREFGVSRKTGYKWIKRFENEASLSNKSHSPLFVPNKTSAQVEQLILSVRSENPAWGGKTIKKVLENDNYFDIPSVKTCNNILKRNHCISDSESLKHKPFIRFEKDFCNEMWQTDFKGDFLLLDGSRCFPLTILDDHSRFSIMIDPKPNTIGVLDSFKRAFYEFGMPNSILSDNGAQFSGFRGGYTQFERWLMDHDIFPKHGRIMHPQTQGKIERFHRTMNQELLKHCQFSTLDDANNQLQEWRTKYNCVRPHEALSMRCPSEVYTASDKEYVDKVKEYDYCGEFHMIKVNNWGYLRYAGFQIYLSETMRNTYLEIRPKEDDTFAVYYRNFVIASLNPADGKLLNRRIAKP